MKCELLYISSVLETRDKFILYKHPKDFSIKLNYIDIVKKLIRVDSLLSRNDKTRSRTEATISFVNTTNKKTEDDE